MESPRKQVVLENPGLVEAEKAVKSGISRRKTVIVVGGCTVDYSGRASSALEFGERIVLIKGDGAALVHRPKDYSPVNWQPPGSIFKTVLDGGALVIRVYRRKERETMEIRFTSILMVSVVDLLDVGEFTMWATENDMQEAILYRPELLEEGFRPISKERSVDPGFIDILGVDKDGNLVVVEIKRVKASKDAVEQLRKYMDVIDVDENRVVRAIIVAPGIADNARELVSVYGYEFKELSPQVCAEVLKEKKGKPLTAFFELR
jgi:RecB family endonuclease NucS